MLSLSLATNCCGFSRGPEGNSRSSRDDLSSLRMFRQHRQPELFSSWPLTRSGVLAVASDLSPKALEDALLFRFSRRAGWPAFYYLKSAKAEEHLPRRFQIES